MAERPYHFDVLFEDNHLLVVNKRAGWIVQGAQPGDASLLEEAKSYIADKYDKPGAVYLGVVSRLDREVTGVLPLARTSKAAARLNAQFQERSVEKLYWALVHGRPSLDESRLHHWLTRDERIGKTLCHASNQPGSVEAILTYRTLATSGDHAWLEIRLETGRKHQIRAQLETVGCSIVGDRKYGSTSRLDDNGIALHCRRMELAHPTTKAKIAWQAALPASWRNYAQAARTDFDFGDD